MNDARQTGATDRAQARLLRLATAASFGTALMLITIKLGAWWQTDAVSLLASLLDSLLDAVASLLTLLAVRYALVPADREHRFGHGKAEPLAALLQALLILGSCAFIAIEAVDRLQHPARSEELPVAIAVMVIALVATFALISFQGYVLRRTQSPAIRADRVHYSADVLSNAATLLALFLTEQGILLADPVFAFAISAWLLYAARDVLRQALDQLLDRELPTAERRVIAAAAAGVEGVVSVAALRTRRAGRTRYVQLAVALDRDLPISAAQAIVDAVKQVILERFPDADVLIVPAPVRQGMAKTHGEAAGRSGQANTT
jgi:ferrous-iron efflux pump FieF